MRTLGVITQVAYGCVDYMVVVEQVGNDVARNETSGSRYADATHNGHKSKNSGISALYRKRS
jgi:hypothetical protein